MRETRPTDGVTLPAAPTLAEAGAVHHVAHVVSLGERLVHVVRLARHDALVWRDGGDTGETDGGQTDSQDVCCCCCCFSHETCV